MYTNMRHATVISFFITMLFFTGPTIPTSLCYALKGLMVEIQWLKLNG